MKPTIKDIANRTGFSTATVSLVLNKKDARISKETRELILAEAEKMCYSADPTAVALRTKRSFTLGVILPDLRNDYYACYAKGMEDYCQQNGWYLMLCSSNNQPSRERRYLEMLHNKGVDGISLALASDTVETPSPSKANIDLLMSYNIPVVVQDMTFFRPRMNAVMFDHEYSGRLLAEHMLELGHRKIAVITGNQRLEGAKSLFHGVEKTIQEHGLSLDPALVYEGDFKYETGIKAVEAFGNADYSAIIAANDTMAYGAIYALKLRGKRVPEDVSVSGHDDIAASSQYGLSLTTVHVPTYEMGCESARILIAAAGVQKSCFTKASFEVELMVRDSTAPYKEP